MIVYNPLAGGLLTGKHAGRRTPEPGTRFTLGASGELYRDRYWHAAQFEAVATLNDYCQRRGWNLATASVAWVLQQPGITSAIVGASRPEQLEATLAATELGFDDEARRGLRRGLVVNPTAPGWSLNGSESLSLFAPPRKEIIITESFRGAKGDSPNHDRVKSPGITSCPPSLRRSLPHQNLPRLPLGDRRLAARSSPPEALRRCPGPS